jgi:mannosyl-oligosaccharide alpha-1,2-mannosidase
MRFAHQAAKIHKTLFGEFPDQGLYPERLYADSGRLNRNTRSVDAMSDSFYEYLIKIFVMTNRSLPIMLDRYLMATKEIESKLLVRLREGSWTYLTRLVDGQPDHQMTHLATFAAGMLAVGSVKKNPRAVQHLELADELISTYVKLYQRFKTGLMPECVKFSGGAVSVCDTQYQLRPETIESLYVMYRFTGLKKYRDFAWTIFQHIEQECKVAFGYATIRDVDQKPPRHDDHMDSYFLAETLKYLYLIFSGSNLLPTGSWVFNTEAHPLRVWTQEEAARMAKEIRIT